KEPSTVSNSTLRSNPMEKEATGSKLKNLFKNWPTLLWEKPPNSRWNQWKNGRNQSFRQIGKAHSRRTKISRNCGTKLRRSLAGIGFVGSACPKTLKHERNTSRLLYRK